MERVERLIERSYFFFMDFELFMVSAERDDVATALQTVGLTEQFCRPSHERHLSRLQMLAFITFIHRAHFRHGEPFRVLRGYCARELERLSETGVAFTITTGRVDFVMMLGPHIQSGPGFFGPFHYSEVTSERGLTISVPVEASARPDDEPTPSLPRWLYGGAKKLI